MYEIDPALQAVLNALSPIGKDVYRGVAPSEALKRLRAPRSAAPMVSDSVVTIVDTAIPAPYGQVPVRLYRPTAVADPPILLNFHGGGWAMGGLAMDDARCRLTADWADCLVVSVDYRLAPEHKFPAALEDGYAVARWLAGNGAELGGDGSRLAICGSSAGANLAAALAMMARDRGDIRFAFQWLLYPVCDSRMDSDSYRRFADGPVLTADMMAWFWDLYIADEADRGNPYATPALAADLGNLPPALIATAELDPLRDEGEHYAEQLRAAGVAATCTRHAGTVHGFISTAPALAQSLAAIAEGAEVLKSIFR